MKKSQKWTVTTDKFLSRDEVAILIKHLRDQRDLALARAERFQQAKDYYLIRGILETGVRAFELCALREEDLKGLRLVIRRGKGGRSRTVLLTKSTTAILNEWLSLKPTLGFETGPQEPFFPNQDGVHYSTRGIRKRVKLVFAALRLPGHLSVHSLRHTNVSLLLENNVNLATIKDNLGHHSIVRAIGVDGPMTLNDRSFVFKFESCHGMSQI